MKIITYSLIIFLLGSCATQKRCELKYPPEVSTDSIYIETVKFDTITIKTPADTTNFTFELPFDLFFESEKPTVYATENTKQKVTATIKEKIVVIESICKEDSLQDVIYNLETALKYTTKEVKKVRYVPKFNLIMTWVGIILFGVILAYLVLKIKTWVK